MCIRDRLLIEKWDLIVVAVSSIGIELVKKYLKNLNKKTYLLVLTKGLKFHRKKNKIITMSEQLDLRGEKLNISVLKGPCLAIELTAITTKSHFSSNN